jgi:hypothetical protein
MHERFEKQIEEGLGKIQTSCLKKKQKPVTLATRVGRLLGQNTRAAALLDVKVEADAGGFARQRWLKGGNLAHQSGPGAAEVSAGILIPIYAGLPNLTERRGARGVDKVSSSDAGHGRDMAVTWPRAGSAQPAILPTRFRA